MSITQMNQLQLLAHIYTAYPAADLDRVRDLRLGQLNRDQLIAWVRDQERV
jgi:hypothetical protein